MAGVRRKEVRCKGKRRLGVREKSGTGGRRDCVREGKVRHRGRMGKRGWCKGERVGRL